MSDADGSQRRIQEQRFKPRASPFAQLENARWDDYPGFIEPCHPTQRGTVPKGDRWIHEIKVDGYRCQLHLWHGAVMAYTRRGYNWAKRFGSIAEAAKGLRVCEAIIDGEVIVASPEGLSDFAALQEDLGAGRSDRMTFYAFDLLFADGYDLRAAQLIARKESETRPNDFFSPSISGKTAPLSMREHVK